MTYNNNNHNSYNPIRIAILNAFCLYLFSFVGLKVGGATIVPFGRIVTSAQFQKPSG
jgi:hypothetical protein